MSCPLERLNRLSCAAFWSQPLQPSGSPVRPTAQCFEDSEHEGLRTMALPIARWIVATVLLLPLTFTAMSQERREVPSFRAYGEPASAQDGAAVQRFIEQYKDAAAPALQFFPEVGLLRHHSTAGC